MTTTDVAAARPSALAVSTGQSYWTEEQLAALRQIGVEDAAPGDLAVFLNYAQRTGLDPFSRQIYMIGRWDGRTRREKWTIQASIDGLRIVAQRSGDYRGQVGPEWCGPDGAWRDVWLGEEPPAAARVGVLRDGFAAPLYAVAIFREYAATDKDGRLSRMWREKGALMIAKCAEALALRKAFPHDLSGVYTAEEMAQADRPQPARHQEAGQHGDAARWEAAVDEAATVDDLRSTWKAARKAGALTLDLHARIDARLAALAEPEPGPADVDPETGEIVDAELEPEAG